MPGLAPCVQKTSSHLGQLPQTTGKASEGVQSAALELRAKARDFTVSISRRHMDRAHLLPAEPAGSHLRRARKTVVAQEGLQENLLRGDAGRSSLFAKQLGESGSIPCHSCCQATSPLHFGLSPWRSRDPLKLTDRLSVTLPRLAGRLPMLKLPSLSALVRDLAVPRTPLAADRHQRVSQQLLRPGNIKDICLSYTQREWSLRRFSAPAVVF